MPRSKLAWLTMAALLLAYAIIVADRPTQMPPIGQDEPWIASVSFKLATQGVYGSDLFAGYYGMEHHYYDFMPVYPLALAGVFKVAGVGVLQMRLLPTLCGALVLILTFAVGRRIGGWPVGALAALLLLALRLATRPGQLGIPLLDTARVGRYDVAVPVFGLLALLETQNVERKTQNGANGTQFHSARFTFYVLRFTFIGALCGLAGLTHLYGAFWLPALLMVLVAQRGWKVLRAPAPYLLVAGFALAWIPWALYVAADLRDYAGQLRIVSERFAVLDPAFYAQNLARELDRYALLDITGRWGLPRPARAGAWAAIVGLPLGLGLAAWRSFKTTIRSAETRVAEHQRSSAANARDVLAVALALLTQMFLFALLLQPKTYSYLVSLWPLAALLLAWLFVRLWNAWRAMLLRVALAALLVAVLAEGGGQIAASRASVTSSYEALGERIAAAIPPGSRVLGLHTYWLALRQFPFRSWAVPVLLANGRYNREEQLSFDTALERVAPTIVLIDPEMATFLRALADPAHPQHAWLAQYETFMRRHDARLTATVNDATYGTIQVYRLFAPSALMNGTP